MIHELPKQGKALLLVLLEGIKLTVTTKTNALFHVIHGLKMGHPFVIYDLEHDKTLKMLQFFLSELLLPLFVNRPDLFLYEIRKVLHLQRIKLLFPHILRS